MNDNDSVRDRQHERGDEELEEATVGEAGEREEGPAADDGTIDQSPAETATSPTGNEPHLAESAAPVAPRQDDTPSSEDEAGESASAEAAAGEPEARVPSPQDEPLPTGHAGEEGHHAAQEGEYPERRPFVVLEAGTDEQSRRALEICRDKVKELRLRMQPLAARYDDERHVTIFFRAEDKVDFRKLVRELSRLLHARIEMRQLGPREQGRLCGLVGKCGYPLCCRTFLNQFAQSSIKMAKTQDLALNPMKISGVCGRLLCCLNYEQEMYADAKSRMPKVNRFVETEFGRGRVASLNVLRQTVTVQYETGTRELSLEQLKLSEAPSSHGAPEDTSAIQHESRNSGTEHDTRTHEESPEH